MSVFVSKAVNVLSASVTWSQGRSAVPKASATRLTQRRHSLAGAGWRQAPAIPQALAAMLKDSCVDVRQAAASALGTVRATSAAEALAALDSGGRR